MESQSQLDQLSHPAKRLFAQACNRWAVAALFAGMVVAGSIANFWRKVKGMK